MKIIMLFAVAIAVVASAAAVHPPGREPMITVWVKETATNRGVVHPMVCIREFNNSFGPIGDSTGKVVFGGSLPSGQLHLRIVAPRYFPFDTVATWPPPAGGSEVRVALKPNTGPSVDPICPSGGATKAGAPAP